jgi:hypothetical protein
MYSSDIVSKISNLYFQLRSLDDNLRNTNSIEDCFFIEEIKQFLESLFIVTENRSVNDLMKRY